VAISQNLYLAFLYIYCDKSIRGKDTKYRIVVDGKHAEIFANNLLYVNYKYDNGVKC
jgi:hypothetical protein